MDRPRIRCASGACVAAVISLAYVAVVLGVSKLELERLPANSPEAQSLAIVPNLKSVCQSWLLEVKVDHA